MAFVNEPMGEAGVELVRSLNLPMPPGFGGGMLFDKFQPLPSRIWSIDRERNLHFFVLCGIGRDKGEPPKYCCLNWDGFPIRVDVFDVGTGNNIDGIRDVWDIIRILAPRELQKVSQEQMCETIKEAFVVYSNRGNKNVKSVDFPNMSGVRFVSQEYMWR